MFGVIKRLFTKSEAKPKAKRGRPLGSRNKSKKVESSYKHWTEREIKIVEAFVKGCKDAGLRPDYDVVKLWLKGKRSINACRIMVHKIKHR